MNEQQVNELIKKYLSNYSEKNQYNISMIPYHLHTGADSPNISYKYLRDKQLVTHHTLYGGTAAVSANYSSFIVAPFQMFLTSAYEMHTVAGTDAGAVTLQIERLTGTTAPGSGVTLLTSTGFNLKGAVNTVQTATISDLSQGSTGTVILKGDRVALKLSGVPTSLTDMSVTMVFGF